MIYNLFELNKQDDWWEEIGEDHQKAIKESIAEADKGMVIPHSEMVKKYRKWLKKYPGQYTGFQNLLGGD